MADTEIQLLEQEKLIEQLKSMIRERDDAFVQKEKELQVSLGIIWASTQEKPVFGVHSHVGLKSGP